MKIKLLFLLFFTTLLSSAQNPTDVEHNFGTFPGFNNEIKSTVIQPDGKIIVAGIFSHYQGANQNALIRINADGSKDTTFDLGTGFYGLIQSVALQSDGKILVGGDFTKFQGASQNGLIRLNPDGSKDMSFDIGTGFIDNKADFHDEPTICAIAVQADGKIIVGGDFIDFQGTTQNYLIRLNTDGSEDTSFNIGTGLDNTVYSVVVQTDGKIIAGGDFNKFNELNYQNRLIRLNTDGSMDTSFKIGTGFDYKVMAIALQNDGKIVASGWFDNYNGKTKGSLIRLNTDGSNDTSFNVYRTSFYPGSVETVAIQSDGKIIIGGTFSPANLLRLNADGSLDASFATGTGFGGSNGIHINCINIKSNGKIIAGGDFGTYQGITETYFIVINPDGSNDNSFNKGKGFNNKIYSTSLQTDGKILVGGNFTDYLNGSQKRLVRFNVDGSKDNSFDIGKGFNSSVYSTVQQSDGKVIVGGAFTTYQDVAQNYLTRLNADGGRDFTFDLKTGFNGNIRNVTMQADGKIIVNGEFTTYQGSSQKRLIRLNTDGSKDNSFNIGTGFDGSVLAVALQPNGKLIVGGNFKNYQGVSQNYLIRLNLDGSKDTSFDIGTGFGSQYTLGTIQTIILQPDGKILVGGQFKYYQGKNYNYLIRLNSDGSIDTSFNIGGGFNYYVYSLALQNDGKIIVAGGFTLIDNYSYDRLARLNSDGSKDLSFNVGSLFTLNFLEEFIYSGDYIPAIYSLSLESDGKLVVGGGFTGYKGDNSSAFLIRLKGDYDEKALSATATPTNVSCPSSSDGSASISVSNGKSPYSYLWSNGATTETITGLSAGTYSCTVKDADSKTISKNLIISAASDIENPTIIAPEAVTVSTNLLCRASGVILGTPVTTDNCSVDSVTNNAPATFPIGNTTVTWTVKDTGNNTATATQIVTVKDVTLPTLIAPADKIVNAGSDCKAWLVTLGTPTTADNCSVTSVTNNAPSSYPIGNTTVTWTVKDASNNTAMAIQIVTVKDVTLPTITAPTPKTVNADLNGTATGIVLGTPITADNCAVASVTNNAPTTFPLGNTTVTWVVKDASDNTATATQIVTVKDFIPLTITAPADKTVNITTSNCTAKGVILGTLVKTSGCNVSSITNNAPTEFPLGNTTVTWTVKDVCNNTATVMQIITVKETVLPTITAPPSVIVNANLNGTATGIVLGTPITSDNCAVASVTNNAPTTFQLGNTTVTWTVKDASNNTATAMQIVTVTNSAPTTLIPDVNFEKKLIALGIDSGTTDGKILTANISSLTSLDVSNSLISNLTGIQDFVSLTNLNCYNNQLTNIDVTKNIALTNLNCGLNQLASLDISKNTALTYLTCTNMQKLTTLDVSKNVALLDLYCYNNQLTALDISQNVALLNVHCMTNKLTTLDVSKNTALTTLWCSSNQLTTLNVSKNGSLVNLKCDSNQLINLDLRNGNNTILSNSKSSSFTNNPNLTCIQVDNVTYSNANWTILKDAKASYNTSCAIQQYTLIPDLNFEKKLIALGIDSGATDGKVLTSSISSLTSLDVSWSSISDLTGIQDFGALTSLNCSGNKLTNLYDPNQLTSLDISKNVALTSLYCNSNQLTSLDVSKNTALTALNCSSNKLTTLDVSKNLALSDLDCSYVNLTTLDVSKNTSLLALKCFNNQLTTLDVTKNSALKFLNCYSNQLSTIDVSNNVSLDTLRCSSNKLIRLDVSKNVNLKRLFCSNNKLESLNLKNGNNSKIDVNNYNLGFSYNPDLTCIQVDDKTYSDANWSTFKDATASYSENCAPSSIIVSSEFEDKLIALGIDKDGKNGSVLLASITNVTSIDVSNSGITNLSGIEYFKDLVTLICNGNVLTTINLSNNTALKYLDCSNNPLTALDVSKNILLTELYFNGLVIKLNKNSSSKISNSASLTTLNLTNNLLLTKLDCSNNKLTSLDVSKNTLLTDINCSNNSLQNLNVSNGNNTNMLNVNFKSNSTLSCIKVDDEVFSNANWAGAKDATAIYSKTACTLGIENVVSNKICVYPNPVKGHLHIDNIVLEKITVYDALGKLIKTTKFTNASDSNTIDLSNLTKGIYFIYLQSEGTSIARKIIVE